ncbi:hypothetical protein FT663_04733 [Candidozyma haemuli var. vulneris]|uniref:Protein BFR2 n=1 Tax=Candidozyma haemuli TaxID=45357 RepID=A0A2V1AQS7_9ASCO|nr:hypothetical protein CXQ85_001981 [[Candida] haemuloni]KAF3985589.1 hypothetical protein FT662_05051 [[Candida] haemuloni var. vulneris]KAF3986789.1 hypothetical protein FT663_04733 [[Candida] haemuloni var. vulneris]PVH20198.1 hypothetical protein CXQ85_001981 [[Candida] haemuloni]
MAKKSLAEKFAESDQPPDFDIENEDSNPFARIDEEDFSASDESDEELKKGHYVSVGKSKLRDQNGSLVKGEKYKGALASRKDLYEDSDGEEPSDSGSDEADEDDEEQEEEENDSDSGASLRANSDEESSDEGSDEGSDEEKGSEDEEDADVKREKIRAMMTKERKHIVNRLSEAATQEALKGYSILQQHKLFDSLIDVRLKVQKGLTDSNLLPGNHETLEKEELGNDSTEDILEKASEKCYSLLDSILQLRSRLYVKENVVVEPVEHKPKKRSLESYLEASSKYDTILNDYRSNVLTKWSAKIQNSSGSSAMNASKFKALNQSAEQQVMNNLADMDRLVKRTKLNRKQLKPLGYEFYEASKKENEESGDEDDEEDADVPKATQSRSLNVQEMDSIFDDEDFYRVLLNDLVDRKIQSTDPTSGLQFAMRGAASAKVKKNVDNKASKGRKLRYHVQEPIANFETRQSVLKWEDDQIDEFFASLLGQKVSMKEDVSDDEEEEEEPLVGDNTIKLFG